MIEAHTTVRSRLFPPHAYLVSTHGALDLPASWQPRLMVLPDQSHVYLSDDLSGHLAQNAQSGAFVFVLGLLIDQQLDTMDHATIAAALLAQCPAGEDAVYRYADAIAGRYIILFRTAGQSDTCVFSDACGTFKVTYDGERGLFSSSAFLIGYCDPQHEPVYRSAFTTGRDLWLCGVLGDYTPIEGVRILTPNHRLTLSDYTIRRFYPRSDIVSDLSVADVAAQVLALCRAQVRLLGTAYTLVSGLTAGLDSRVSAAVSHKETDDLTFFTFYVEGDPKVDAVIADRIAGTAGLNHIMLMDDKALQTQSVVPQHARIHRTVHHRPLLDDIKAWDWYRSRPGMAHVYKTTLVPAVQKDKPVIHIRSNLYEIGRAFWGVRKGPCNRVADILPRARPSWTGEVAPIFATYFEDNAYAQAGARGLDLLDLFYWEHRCGTWVSEVVSGTDFAFNTLTYVNSRQIIELLLRVPFADRASGAVFKAILAEAAPELADIPVNPKM